MNHWSRHTEEIIEFNLSTRKRNTLKRNDRLTAQSAQVVLRRLRVVSTSGGETRSHLHTLDSRLSINLGTI